MKTIDATREVVQSAQQTLDVAALPIDTRFFIFLDSPDDDQGAVRFVRVKRVSSGLIALSDTGPCSSLRVRHAPSDGMEVVITEPPQCLAAGDILECYEDDEWHSLAIIRGMHVPRG